MVYLLLVTFLLSFPIHEIPFPTLILGLSLSRPATALPSRDDHLEKVLFDGIVWRQQSIANKEILTLIFVMMVNSKGQEICGEYFSLKLSCFKLIKTS